jgi:hypothetical protein
VRQAPGRLDVPLGQFLADVPAARMQHEPHPARVLAVLLEAELDEMVSAAQGAHLLVGPRLALLHARVQQREPGPERLPPARAVLRLDRPVVGAETHRDRRLDGRPYLGQVIGELAGGQAGPDGRHPAADVHADRGRADGLLHGDHRADRGALAVVHVRHDGHLLSPRQRRHVAELLQRAGVDRRRVGPHLHGCPGAGQEFVGHQLSPFRLSYIC